MALKAVISYLITESPVPRSTLSDTEKGLGKKRTIPDKISKQSSSLCVIEIILWTKSRKPVL